MSNRKGISLVEVMVAALLLAVGVAGSLSALLAAAQLRSRASVREAVALSLETRLSWFAANACAFTGDTVLRSSSGTRLVESWRVLRDSAGARLEGRVVGGGGPLTLARTLVVSRRCP